MPTYKLCPVIVSRAFRELVWETYPALFNSPHAHAYRNIMQYLLFSTFRDEDTGELLLPYETMAALVGSHPKRKGFNAQVWIERFSEEVLPLHATDYRYTQHKARQIAPEVDLSIQGALWEMMLVESIESKKPVKNSVHAWESLPESVAQGEFSGTSDKAGKDGELTESVVHVWFDTGKPVSRRNAQDAYADYELYLREFADTVSPDHPAYELIQYLHDAPQACLDRVLKRNWPRVCAMVEALPEETQKEKGKKAWCLRLVMILRRFHRLYYKDSDRTVRLSAVGASLHQLPRAIRQAAFGGSVECDLKAAQLAVVARLWDIPDLQDFLEQGLVGGPSIWDELLSHIQQPLACKPLVKQTIYSIVFGMTKKNLLSQLATGTARDPGIGEEKAKHLLSHRLIRSLLRARTKQRDAVWLANGAYDAWGTFRSTQTLYHGNKCQKNIMSVLASVVQSYEMQLMISVLPVIKNQKQLYLLSWLHDGIVVFVGDKSKAERQLRQLQEAVKKEADRLQMATYLEIQHLP